MQSSLKAQACLLFATNPQPPGLAEVNPPLPEDKPSIPGVDAPLPSVPDHGATQVKLKVSLNFNSYLCKGRCALLLSTSVLRSPGV